MSPLLSVVMPTHNRAGELRRAAASVLGQQADLELVVVDDHSDDGTADELDRLAASDTRVRVVRLAGGTPVGPCAARNRGLEIAEGELVGFCDDDDRWADGAAPTILEFLDDHPEVVAASSWHEVSHPDLGRTVLFRGPTEYEARHLLWQNLIALPFAVIRRTRLPFTVSFDPALPTGEDWDLFLRCAQHGTIRTVPVACYVYTQHGGDRVTRARAGQIEGRRGFVAKHGGSMAPSCRLYHETVLAGLEHGRAGMRAALSSAARRAPARAALVAAILGTSAAASRVGQRRGDPGLQARLMAALVGRVADRR